MTTATPDLWHHYGRTRAANDPDVPTKFSWTWDQHTGPGAEILGDLTGAVVADLGAGAARHAAHLAVHHQPTHVDAIDASPAQHAMASGLYAELTPRLHLVHADVVDHLRAHPDTYDVAYAVFGAPDFTDPRVLLPVAARALRSGGRLVFSTLAHYRSGKPAETDVIPADVPAKLPDGSAATLSRWVLQAHVWAKLLKAVGLVDVTVEELPAVDGGPGTLLVTASRHRIAQWSA
ncbi:class I SAM-dependent methyltransferase [Streptomyces smaragdinus]|uniref:class I SAM-dependent methyltransferase n=1 Tax=Streptomyces smaragdinus TaxID=2585196 RepID=UPI00389A7923